MKKFKALISLALALCMILTLAACGSSTGTTNNAGAADNAGDAADNTAAPSSAGGGTLTLAMIGDGAQKNRLDELLGMYTEQSGVKVESIYIPGNWTEYCTKIQTMVGGGDTLDCAIMAIEGIELFVGMGLTAPLDDYVAANKEQADTILNDINPDLHKPFTVDGKMYAFPFSWNNVVMHVNTKLLDEAGLDIPSATWNKEQFLEYCEKLTTEKDGVKQFAIAVPYGEYFCAEAWLFNNNATYMNDDFTESLINSPESVEIFQLWQDLIYKYGYAPVPEQNVNAIQQLVNGQVAMGTWGRWPTTTYIDNNFNDVAIQFLPNFKTNTMMFGVDGIFVLESSKNLKQAQDLAAWMSMKEFEGGYLTTGNIPALKSLAEESISSLGIPKNYELYYEGTAPLKPVSSPPQFTECSQIVLRAISEVCVNQADVQSTLDSAAEEMNAILAANK